jgi:transcriptional regulator of arginine metabolism
MSTKAQRQQALIRIIENAEVSSQTQLQKLLAKEGIKATQVTVSRDLEEVGAIKVRSSSGDTVYAIATFEPARRATNDQLRRVMSEWVAEVSHSGQMVVLRTPPGCAHVVASALDRAAPNGLLGTVAGDDTIICVATEGVGGKKLANELRSLAGLKAGKS